MSLTAAERETVIVMCDDDDVAHIYTAQRSTITKLRKNAAAVLVEEGVFEGSPWARFELPKGLVSFRSRRVRRELTDEQRAVLTERLHARKAQKRVGK